MPLINENSPLSDKIHYRNQKLGKEWRDRLQEYFFKHALT